jgi:hypothetical protein
MRKKAHVKIKNQFKIENDPQKKFKNKIREFYHINS